MLFDDTLLPFCAHYTKDRFVQFYHEYNVDVHYKVHMSHAGTEPAEYTQIIITSSQ